MPSFKRIKLKDVAYRDLGNKRTVGACKIVACRGYWVPSRSFNQSITVERWSRSIKLARMGTKSVVVMGSVNHRQANLQMIKLWPRSGLGGETRTVNYLGQSTGRAAVALASSSRLAAPAVGTHPQS